MMSHVAYLLARTADITDALRQLDAGTADTTGTDPGNEDDKIAEDD